MTEYKNATERMHCNGRGTVRIAAFDKPARVGPDDAEKDFMKARR